MKINVFIMLSLFCVALVLQFSSADSIAADLDNEFAEFEDADVDDIAVNDINNKNDNEKESSEKPINTSPSSKSLTEEDNDDDDEFIDEDDDDEFIKVEKSDDKEKKSDSQKPEPLKFADVPAHFRSNWASYQVEALVLLILIMYMTNYIVGRSRNQSIAQKWFTDVTPLLEDQFVLVGDDGTMEDLRENHMVKETDFTYTIWCSGRAGCQGILITLKLQKRQDLINVIMGLIRPRQDQIIVRIDIDSNEMDSFVFAVGQKKSLSKVAKEMMDLSMFAVERKGLDKLGLPASMIVYAEIFEAVSAIIDPSVLSILRKYESSIDYFHFSDQYSGCKPTEGETNTRLPETSRVLIFAFNMSNDTSEIEALMKTVFYCLEKVRRYRLSKEGKQKADKKRQSVQEAFLKTTHQSRQEAAQARREEKTRERKQRLLEEEDPEKQRRLEKLEQKRDMKSRQPKMKHLKVK